MAEQIGSMYAQLTIDTRSADANLLQTLGVARRTEQGFQRSLGVMGQSVDRFNRSSSSLRPGAILAAGRAYESAADRINLIRSAMLSATAVAGGFGAALASNVVLRYADAAAKLSNNLRTVTSSASEARAAVTASFQVAGAARAGVQSTAQLVGRIQRTDQTEALTKTLRRTLTIQRGLQIGGASRAEADSVATQLTQGLASETLGGEELRAIRETPLGQFLAKGLGVRVGDLKALGEAGKLTSAVVKEALDRVAAEIDATFAQTAITVDQAFTAIDNAATAYIGKIDQAYGATRLLSSAALGVAENLDAIGAAAGYAGLALGAAFAGRGLSSLGGRIADPIRRERQNAQQELDALRKVADETRSAREIAARDVANANLKKTFRPETFAPRALMKEELRAREQLSRAETEHAAATARLAEMQRDLGAVTSTTNKAALQASERRIKAEAALAANTRRRAAAAKELASSEAAARAAAGYDRSSPYGRQFYAFTQNELSKAQAESRRAEDERVRLERRAEFAARRVASLQVEADQKAAQRRVAIAQGIADQQERIARASAMRASAAQGVSQAGVNVFAAGRSGAASAIAEATSRLSGLNAELGRVQLSMSAARVAGSAWQLSLGALTRTWGGFIGLLGGPGGAALTVVIAGIGLLTARLAENAQRAAEAQRIVRELAAERGQAPGASSEDLQSYNTLRVTELKKDIDTLAVSSRIAQKTIDDIIPQNRLRGIGRFAETRRELDGLVDGLRDGTISARLFDDRIAAFIQKNPDLREQAEQVREAAKTLRDNGVAVDQLTEKISKLRSEAESDIEIKVRLAVQNATGPDFGGLFTRESIGKQIDDAAKRVTFQQDVDRERRLAGMDEEATKTEAIYERLKRKRTDAGAGAFFSDDDLRKQAGEIRAIEKAAEDREAAAKKAAAAAERETKAYEKSAEIVDRIAREGEGAFLGDVDRDVIQKTQRLKDAGALQRQYMDALRTGDLSKAPGELLAVREALQVQEAAKAYREIAESYGTAEQNAQRFADKQAQLNALLAAGLITTQQAAKAWAEFQNGFGYNRVLNDLQFERDQLGRGTRERESFDAYRSAGILDPDGRLTGEREKEIAAIIDTNAAIRRMQEAVDGTSASLLAVAKSATTLKEFGKGLLETVAGKALSFFEGEFNRIVDDGIKQAIAYAMGGDEAVAKLAPLGSTAANAMWVQMASGGAGALTGAVQNALTGGAAAGDVTRAPLPPIGAANDNVANARVAAAWSAIQTSGTANLGGLNSTFKDRLAALSEGARGAGVDFSVFSAYRSPERQAELWKNALAKYGSPEAARKWVAPPGWSMHNFGEAADLRFGSPAARDWAHENAGRYGLRFPMENEPWHIEPVGGRRQGGNLGASDAGLSQLDAAAGKAASSMTSVDTSAAQLAQVTLAPSGQVASAAQNIGVAAGDLSASTSDAAASAQQLPTLGQSFMTGLQSVGSSLIGGLGNIASGLLGRAGEGTGGFLSMILGGLFGGARARGGPVNPGKLYMVGENGPELAAFGQAGRIIPAGITAGMMNPRVPTTASQPMVTVQQNITQMRQAAPERETDGGITVIDNVGVRVKKREGKDDQGRRRPEIVLYEKNAEMFSTRNAGSRAAEENYYIRKKGPRR